MQYFKFLFYCRLRCSLKCIILSSVLCGLFSIFSLSKNKFDAFQLRFPTLFFLNLMLSQVLHLVELSLCILRVLPIELDE